MKEAQSETPMYTVDQNRHGSLCDTAAPTQDLNTKKTLRAAQSLWSRTAQILPHTHTHTRIYTHITLLFRFAGEVVAKAQNERVDWSPLLITVGTSWIGWFHKGSFSRYFPISSCTNRWISHYSHYGHTLLIQLN